MKTTNFLKKDYFGLSFFSQLFNKTQKKNKSGSLEELKHEIGTVEYKKRIKHLIKQDFLLRYEAELVEKGLKDMQLELTVKDTSHLQVVKEKDPEPVQKHPAPTAKLHEILTDEKKQEVWKVHNRIPKWFKSPHQINSRILIAYMDLLGENKSVPLYKLEAACKTIKTFQSNYNQMKIIGDKNHAKVFEEAGERITLWEPVREFVIKEFKKRNTYN